MNQATLEAELTERVGRPTLLFPSGRLALHAAFTTLLAPGARMLLSPLDDDVVAYAALAAGIRPVAGPVAPTDGNLDPDAVDATFLDGLDGILTTNLYGLPDRAERWRAVADDRGIPLVEDAAHGWGVRHGGVEVGALGTVTAHSFSKHVGAGHGGALSVADAALLPGLREARAATVRSPWSPRAAGRRVGTATLRTLGLERRARRARDRWRGPDRPRHRMDPRPADLARALRGEGPPGVDRMDRWLRVDLPTHRVAPTGRTRHRLAVALAEVDGRNELRRAGTVRLTAHPAVAAGAAGIDAPLFRVPFLVRDRDRVADRLAAAGIRVDYVYDPPLDDVLPAHVAPAPDPEVARHWAAHVLPIDPLEADRLLDEVLPATGLRLDPAPEPGPGRP